MMYDHPRHPGIGRYDWPAIDRARRVPPSGTFLVDDTDMAEWQHRRLLDTAREIGLRADFVLLVNEPR